MTKTEVIDMAVGEICHRLDSDSSIKDVYNSSADNFVNTVRHIAADVIKDDKYKEYDLDLTILVKIAAEDYALSIDMHNDESE